MIQNMLNQQALPTISFFYTDNCERQAIAPIAEEAQRRGFNTHFSMDSNEFAEIGVYCEHACRPNADFSVIMLHDLAQRHDIWPKFWQHEPWDQFDMGIVPGKSWTDRWQTQAGLQSAKPKLGLFELGWPKADLVFHDAQVFTDAAAELRESLGLKYEQSVLYAPSWENHGKQDDFVQAFKDLPVNVLLKQAPWSAQYGWVLDEIDRMDNLHRGCAENVYIIDREISIMHCLGLADVLVSDESSVLTEALLLDVPGVAVTDWLIPDQNPPRKACVPYDYVTKTTKNEMRQTVMHILGETEAVKLQTRQDRDNQFSHLGNSAVMIMDNIEAAIANRELPHLPVFPEIEHDRREYLRAEQLIKENHFDEGKAILVTLAAKKTACWEVYNDLGILLFNEGQPEDAVALLEGSIGMCEKPVVPLSNLIEIYCAQNREDYALLSLAQLSQHIPSSTKKKSVIKSCMEELIAI